MLPSFRQNTTSEVNNEVSRAFEPYDPSDRQIRQRRSLVSCPVKLKSKICYALAGPEDTRTPGTLRKLKLEGAGLGEKVLQLRKFVFHLVHFRRRNNFVNFAKY